MAEGMIVLERVDAISEEDLNKLLKILASVQYGSITLFIQEGKVVQIEKNEKLRLR